MIFYLNVPEFSRPGVEDVVRLFYPGTGFAGDLSAPGDHFLEISFNRTAIGLGARGRLRHKDQWFSHEDFWTDDGIADTDFKGRAKNLSRLTAYRLLVRVPGKGPTPWGTLTGVRPTKLAHRLLDQGLGGEDLIGRLMDCYALRRDKAALLHDVARRQRKFLAGARGVGIYIGIPFCPSRCLYCSFPAFPLPQNAGMVQPVMEYLLREVNALGHALEETNTVAQTIYIGGGTPTCLPPEILEKLLAGVKTRLVTGETLELTLEGGRPDTLTPDNVELCRAYGVSRLSINPQTMHDRTLQVIGRGHGVADVYRAMDLARRAGIPAINMDIILGLPGETAAHVDTTLRRIGELSPENISVHTLAIKKASRLRRELSNHPLPDNRGAEQMLTLAEQRTKAMGLVPYYLYRQKNMLGNLENVGYALPGKECLYNIQIMEERQTIIGLGVGAGTKLVNPGDLSLTNHFNPKDLRLYMESPDPAPKFLSYCGKAPCQS